MSQCDQILNHLKQFGTITGMEALSLYGCWRLAARICDLRQMGWDIHTQMITSSEKQFARYRLMSKRRLVA